LPADSSIHPVFRVSFLEKKVGGSAVAAIELPRMDEYGRFKVQLVAILDRKIMKKGHKDVVMGLVKWFDLFQEDATGKGSKELNEQFIDFSTNSCIEERKLELAATTN
jgi:hypothetical protein